MKVRNNKEMMRTFVRNARSFPIGKVDLMNLTNTNSAARFSVEMGKVKSIGELEAQYKVEASSPDEEALLLGIGALGYGLSI